MGCLTDPSEPGSDQFCPGLSQRRIEGPGDLGGALPERAITLRQCSALAAERLQIAPTRERKQAIEV